LITGGKPTTTRITRGVFAVREPEARPGLSESRTDSTRDHDEDPQDAGSVEEDELSSAEPESTDDQADEGEPGGGQDDRNTDLLDLLVGATVRELADVSLTAFRSFRRSLRKPARRVARNLKFGPETDLYAATFGSVVLVGDAGMETIHELLGGTAADAGPAFVQAVLARRGTDALYGDVLAALELSIGVFADDPEERVTSAWKLASRTFEGWPAELEPPVASSAYLAWADVVMVLRQRSGSHMDKLLFPAGIPIPTWGDLTG
jgi:hypothetical protein